MAEYKIIKLIPEDYPKCSNIWNMKSNPLRTKKWYDEVVSGVRIIYIYTLNGEFIGEISLVTKNNDPDYTIDGKRIYISRLIVKKEYRGKGIGGILVDFITDKAVKMGYSEASIGVDKENETALHLYRKKGFTEILFDGEDEQGPYYKLLKRLV